jgi:diguanylate cyclase (GGDEF)-like protein/PAS domain S-box-containing protein
MHKVLQQQIDAYLAEGPIPVAFRRLLHAVDQTYAAFSPTQRPTPSSATLALTAERDSLLRELEVCRSMFDHATVGVFQTTPQGQYLQCNPALAHIYGYASPDELKSTVQDVRRQLYVDDDTRPRFVAMMDSDGQVRGFEARVYRKDGSIIWISETARAVKDEQGKLLYYEGFASDITAAKLSEERLRESEERYALAVEGANDGVWDWNLRSGEVYYSPRWRQMLGIPAPLTASDAIDTSRQPLLMSAQPPAPQQPAGDASTAGIAGIAANGIGTAADWFDRVHPEDLESLQAAIGSHREGLTPHFAVEHRMRRADGRYLWALARGTAVRDADGRPTRLAGSLSDVTVRKAAEDQLLRDALHDALTGLPNRVLFTDRLERVLARQGRDPNLSFAVLFLDVDRFKGINDSLGHVIGDQLLVSFAERLRACLRPGDTVARLGGDEFTILLEDTQGVQDAVYVADRILAALTTPFSLGQQEVFVTTSIGIALGGPAAGAGAVAGTIAGGAVATTPSAYTRPQDVLRDADTAMYRAKAQGKSRHQIFDATMHTGALRLLQTENDLRRAMDRGELELRYQPVMPMNSGAGGASRRVRGFEALLRWRHPQRGLIPPADFIPLAEETGLIIPIGRWVLNQACRQAAQWSVTFPHQEIEIAVNLSARQFSQNDLLEQVTSALRNSELSAHRLILEITESVVMENPPTTISTLRRLKELGVQLHIDDFGTGYSSLAYLQRFPVDAMKIDRSFVARMSDGRENAEIVRTIVTLAHNLNLSVTAEGIETPEQMARLAELHCESGQGFLLGKPLEAAEATELIGNLAAGTRAA